MRLFKPTLMLLGLVTAGILATAANAGTLTYESYGFSGENVHIGDSLLGVDDEYSGAGVITLDGSSSISAYCVDIADWLLGSGTYNTGVNPASDPNLAGVSSITGHSKISDIGSLIANGSNAAAVQVAIWETEYGPAITITPDDPGLQAVADAYLADLQTRWDVPEGLSVFELTPADDETNQSLVYMGRMPEPASVAILGTTIILLGYARRRRRTGRCHQ
jgi:hypothetical protein